MVRTLFKILLGVAIAVALPRARNRFAQTTLTQVHRINQ
ncbi:hypothetical protein M2155_008161 [Streptomyces sp. SAI-119]|nr:hypothetical protein [Streptomyces sp. SAI-119]